MSSNIETLRIPGVGPEASRIDSDLLDENGNLRRFADVEKEIGDNQAILTLLEFHLRKRLTTPTTRGYPPRIFITYRRESEAHITWCESLARSLTLSGFEVYLDTLAIWSESPTPDVVAEFIAKLADADIVLAVITDSYLNYGENSMRSWLFEEWSRVSTLQQWGFVEVIAVVRSGDLESSRFVHLSDALGWTIDLRDRPDDFQAVLDFFGRYQGPILTAAEQAFIASRASQVLDCARRGDVPTSEEGMKDLRSYSQTEEYWLAAAWHLYSLGDGAGVVAAAERILCINATLPTTFGAAKALWLADQDVHAVGLLAEVSEGPSLWRHMSHSILGDIFGRLGMLVPATNHVRWCLKASEDAALNSWWSRFSGEALDQTTEYFGRLIAAGGALDASTIAFNCQLCGAQYPENQHVCVLCATSYTKYNERCYLCGSAVVSLDNLTFCPLCRKGLPGSDMEGHNCYLVPREPRGRFSVLAGTNAIEPLRLGRSDERPLGSGQQFVKY